VLRWFDKYLKQAPERKLDMDYTDAPEEQLAVFGGKPPADAQNYRIQETFTTAGPRPVPSSLPAWEIRRAELLALLRKNVFAAGLDTSPAKTGLLRKPSKPAGKVPALLYVASDGEDQAATANRPAPGPHAHPSDRTD